jgi:transposase-like protein
MTFGIAESRPELFLCHSEVGAKLFYLVILTQAQRVVSQTLLKMEVAVSLARSDDRVGHEGGETAMGKHDRKRSQPIAQAAQLDLLPPLHQWIAAAGLAAVTELLERERAALCGKRYRHDPQRRAIRGGSVASSLVLGGRRVPVRRPRVRSRTGQELKLPSWEVWSARDPLTQRALEQMLLGVSTRRYARSLEILPPQMSQRAVGRTAVSRRFITHTEHKLIELMQRRLDTVELPALMIDGVHLGAHVVLVALGIDAGGNKQVLGLWEGATENAAACKALLADLAARGLRTDRATLVVIDGSRALAAAVREVFGPRALIQRCREHKKRNVTDALPKSMRIEMRQLLNRAYAERDPQRIAQQLERHARQLERPHPGAAAALREGLAETLTIDRLGLEAHLARALCTTNPIENLFSRVRAIARRVSHWKDGYMVLRWSAAALTECEPSFHRIHGWQTIGTLIAALRAHDTRLDRRTLAA